MKKIYLLSAAALMGMASCSDYADQFNIGSQISDKKDVSLELADADYATIASLSANKELAAQLDQSVTDGSTPYSTELANLKNTKYFGTMVTADQFLPAFLQDKYPEADIDSKFKVTYNEYCGVSQYLADFSSMKGEYTLTADDYSTAWDGKSTATYLTPSTAGKLPALLKSAYADAQQGDIVVANYAYSDFEPAGTSEDKGEEYTKISEVIANTAGGEYTVKGIVCATYSRGFLLTDNTGYILVYKTSEVNIGDEVSVAGTTSQYAGLMQYSTSAEVTVTKAGKEPNYKHPTPQALSGADIDAYVDAPYVKYVTYTGKLTISGNYYNVAVDGATVQGSLANVPEGMVDASLDGKNIIVYGYTIGAPSNKKYLNTMVTSVSEATSAAKAKAIARVAAAQANKSAVYKYNGSAWEVYSTGDAKVIAAQPSWYDLIGATIIAKPDNYLPTLIQREYPFAADGEKVTVVYRLSDSKMDAAEYTYSATDGWARSEEYKKETTTFSKSESGIEARVSTYLNETLLGDAGGFNIYDVDLGTLSYVWQNTTNYGWKASAYANKTNNTSESWLISSAINFKKAVNPEMVFDEAMKFLGENNIEDFLSVKVSTDFDGTNVTGATWETLTLTGRSDGQSFTFYTIDPVSLSKYNGKNIHIAFVYKSTTEVAPTYEFKNIIVREKEENN